MSRHLSIALALLIAVPGAAALAQLPVFPANPVTAQPQLNRIPLTLTTRTGKHRYRVEVASTGTEQQAGMMFRTAMRRDAGMLFPFVPPRPASFWMENTVLPLDLVFIAPGRRVLNIAANAVPYSRDFIPSAGPVAAVLELNAGEAARIRLRPGDRVTYRLPG